MTEENQTEGKPALIYTKSWLAVDRPRTFGHFNHCSGCHWRIIAVVNSKPVVQNGLRSFFITKSKKKQKISSNSEVDTAPQPFYL